jgi:hypothetical protein
VQASITVPHSLGGYCRGYNPEYTKLPLSTCLIYIVYVELYMQDIKKNKVTASWADILQCRPGYIVPWPDYSSPGPAYRNLGQNISSRAEIKRSRPAHNSSTQLGRDSSSPAGPVLLLRPGWASSSKPRLGQLPRSPAGPGLSPPAGLAPPSPALG